MSIQAAIPEGETGFDRVLRFTVPGKGARGRVVRLGPVLDTILSAHDYPRPILHLLGEALVVAALIGSLLKDDEGQLTLQAQTEGGIVDLLVCDYRGGELRGYVRHDAERLAMLGANPSLYALFGKGYLAITFDLATTNQRYQGIVPLEGASLAEACESYFAQSEQVPTLIRVGVQSDKAGCRGGGLWVQHLPRRGGGPRAAARAARPSRLGACRGADRLGPARRAGRSRPFARTDCLAAAARRRKDLGRARSAPGPWVPLHDRALRRRDRPFPGRRARSDAG